MWVTHGGKQPSLKAMEGPTLFQAEIITTKEPLFGSRRRLFAMSIDFDRKVAVGDQIWKYQFGRMVSREAGGRDDNGGLHIY